MNSKISFTFLKILVFISMFISYLGFPQQLYSQKRRWTFVDQAASMRFTLYIDTNYEVTPNGNLKFWQKSVNSDGSGFTISLTELDCQQKRIRSLQETKYDGYHQQLITKKYDDVWDYVVPDSIGETIFTMLCSNKKPTSKKSTKKKLNSTKVSIVEITTTAASLRESPNVNGNLIREVSLGEQLILANEEPAGSWYKVIDKETQTEGWLHKINFKIIKPTSNKAKPKVSKGKKRS